MISIDNELQHKLENSDKVVLGFSGGVDSIVALDLLAKSGLKNVVAAHINHGISRNANSWEEFCKDKAESYGFEFVSLRVNLKGAANLEEEARKVRYEFFSDLMSDASVLVTAHHMNDQAETFLLRALRGAGVDGLGAMREVRVLKKGTHIRPFLDYPKSDLTKYALTTDLNWVEDESNKSCDYDRNLIRNKVIPLLKEINPQAVKMLSRSAQLSQKASDTIDCYVENILGGNLRGKSLKVTDEFMRLSKDDKILCLRKLLKDNDVQSISEDKWSAFTNSLDCLVNSKNPNDNSVMLDLSDGLILRLYRGELIFSSSDEEFVLSFKGEGFQSRVRKSGDRFFYKGRERKLKDVMSLMKIPSWQRERLPIIVDCEDKVVAVAYALEPSVKDKISEIDYAVLSKHANLTQKFSLQAINKTKE